MSAPHPSWRPSSSAPIRAARDVLLSEGGREVSSEDTPPPFADPVSDSGSDNGSRNRTGTPQGSAGPTPLIQYELQDTAVPAMPVAGRDHADGWPNVAGYVRKRWTFAGSGEIHAPRRGTCATPAEPGRSSITVFNPL